MRPYGRLRVLVSTKAVRAIAVSGTLMLAGLLLIVLMNPGAETTKAFPGRIVKLEAWNFKSGGVRYDLPRPSWWARLAGKLPKWAFNKARLPKPEVTVFAENQYDRKQPFLSAVFSIRDVGKSAGFCFYRTGVSDERGENFEMGPTGSGITGTNARYWIAELPIFPRRNKELRLRLVEINSSPHQTNVFGDFVIPNPAFRSYPRWKAQPLPARATNQALEVTLQNFNADKSRLCTQYSFSFVENGSNSPIWRPISIEISDATGNKWAEEPRWINEGPKGFATVETHGALWPGEDAWKLRVVFERNEFVVLEHLAIPSPDEVSENVRTFGTNGAKFTVAAIIGSRVDIERARQLDKDRVDECVTVNIKGDAYSQLLPMAFLKCLDDQRRELPRAGLSSSLTSNLGDGRNGFSFNFKPQPDAKELNLILAVKGNRTVEFLAKPEQVLEHGSIK
jgi:hypothetical protein